MTENRIAGLINYSVPSAPQASPNSSATPAPTPSGTSAVAGGHVVEYRHEDVAALGDKMEHDVGELLKQARYKLNGDPRGVATGSFTTFAFPLALTYTEALAFADQDLRTKMKALMHFNDLLHKTAANMSEADRKSTVGE